MSADLALSLPAFFAFVLVLARVSGVLAFVPIPGMNATPEPARIILAVSITLALGTRWPVVDLAVSPGRLIGWVLAEGALGAALGVTVSIVLEAFVMAAQILGLQAGYAYASTIDPNTQADSGILLIVAQLTASLLFLASGLDREVLRVLALSLEKVPPGAYLFGPASAQSLIHLGSSLFSVALRLALPVVALLVLVDVALALLGRVQAQLQLLSLAFPVKMGLALLVLAWGTVLFPRILRELGGQMGTTARHLLGP
jgi:flagellar biosynthetic protein FliR